MHGRKILLTMLAAALLVVVVADAAAQQAPAGSTQPTRPQAPVPQAPVGHRQPKLSDLPPDVAQKEGAGPATPNAQERGSQPIQPAIDESLRICKGC
jgi:hypothetical protein